MLGRLSLVAMSGAALGCSVQAAHCRGFSHVGAPAAGLWAQLCGAWASVLARRLSGRGSPARECRLGSCDARV